jgi:pimeloyl-ACP methyl ester carboxylesterase/DNA-binding CsgD family transcriptional regulator
MVTYAESMRFCTSRDGTRIAYAISSNGPPIIRLAGLFTHLEFDRESSIWRPWLGALEKGRLLIRYDARGSGMSDCDGVEFSFERYIEDLEAVAAATGLRRFALFGIGGPAALAVAYAARHPEQVTHLILHAAFTQGRLARATTAPEREEIELILKLMSMGFSDEDPSRRQMIASQFLPDGTAEQLKDFGDLLRVTSTARNTAEFLRAWYTADIRTSLPRVRCPTLVLHPRAGFRVPLEEGRMVAQSIPHARLVPLRTRNTYLPDNDPVWPQVIAEINNFLPVASHRKPPSLPHLDELTPRERAVFGAVIQGLSNKAIARRLGITDKTVRNHLSSIFRKLDITNRAQLIVQAHAVRSQSDGSQPRVAASD